MAGLEGKKLTIFYDDMNHVSRKDGVCTANSDSEIELDYKIVIPKQRVIRMEIVGGGRND